MQIGTQYKANRIIAVIPFGVYGNAKLLAGVVAVSAVKDFAFIDQDGLLLLSGPDILLKAFEFITHHQRKDVCDWVEFIRLLFRWLLLALEITGSRSRSSFVGFESAHLALPSTIACNAASHSPRSHRLEPPILTGRG